MSNNYGYSFSRKTSIGNFDLKGKTFREPIRKAFYELVENIIVKNAPVYAYLSLDKIPYEGTSSDNPSKRIRAVKFLKEDLKINILVAREVINGDKPAPLYSQEAATKALDFFRVMDVKFLIQYVRNEK